KVPIDCRCVFSASRKQMRGYLDRPFVEGCALSVSECNEFAGDEVVLNVKLHIKAVGHPPRINLTDLILAPGFFGCEGQPRKTQLLSFLPLTSWAGRWLRLPVGHGLNGPVENGSNGRSSKRAG